MVSRWVLEDLWDRLVLWDHRDRGDFSSRTDNLVLWVRADQADQAEVHSHLVPSQGPVHRVSEDPFLKELSVRSVPDPIKEPIKEPSEQWHPQEASGLVWVRNHL